LYLVLENAVHTLFAINRFKKVLLIGFASCVCAFVMAVKKVIISIRAVGRRNVPFRAVIITLFL